MLKQQLHGKTIKIFGPPGTGKTFQLLRRIKYFLRKGISPHQIAYFSFTNKAVDETIERISNSLPGYKPDDFPYFATIHSFARSQFSNIPVLDPNDDMMQFHSDYGTVKIGFLQGFEDQKIFNNWSLRIYDRARNMKQDPVALYKQQQKKNVRLPQFISIIAAYERFKSFEVAPGIRQNDRLDFTDMLEKFVNEGHVPKFKVLMIDEAQDLTPLQWDVVIKLAREAEVVYLAGDDDQAIYEWNGAEVDYFIHFPGKKKVLRKSYRIPSDIHDYSQYIASYIHGRKHKEFIPQKNVGSINTYNRLKDIPFSEHGSWIMLGRTNEIVDELRMQAREMGIFFQDSKGRKSFDLNKWRAIQTWNRLMNNESIDREEVQIIYTYINEIGFGWRNIESKRWYNIHSSQELNYDFLNVWCGLGSLRKPWTEVFNRNFPEKEKFYFEKLIDSGIDIVKNSEMIIDTIHSIKGGEADNVVIYEKSNWIASIQNKVGLDRSSEYRVWYVGVTRAKKELHIIVKSGQYGFEL